MTAQPRWSKERTEAISAILRTVSDLGAATAEQVQQATGWGPYVVRRALEDVHALGFVCRDRREPKPDIWTMRPARGDS